MSRLVLCPQELILQHAFARFSRRPGARFNRGRIGVSRGRVSLPPSGTPAQQIWGSTPVLQEATFDTGNVVLNTTTVQQLNDLTGHGHIWTQVTAGSQPTHTANDATLNNQGSALFVTNDYLENLTIPLAVPQLTVIMLKQNAWTNGRNILGNVSGAPLNSMLLIQGPSGATGSLQQNNNAAANGNLGLATTRWGRVYAYFSGIADGRDFVQAGLGLTVSTASGTNTGTGRRIATNSAASSFASISVAYVATIDLTSSTLTAAKLNAMDAWLTSKYGSFDL